MNKNFKIPKHGLISFAKRGETKINYDGGFETELIDIDVKWIGDCSNEEVEEFRKNGFVLKTNTNYNKKL